MGSMHLEVLAEVLLVDTVLLVLCATFLFALYAALLAFHVAILQVTLSVAGLLVALCPLRQLLLLLLELFSVWQ